MDNCVADLSGLPAHIITLSLRKREMLASLNKSLGDMYDEYTRQKAALDKIEIMIRSNEMAKDMIPDNILEGAGLDIQSYDVKYSDDFTQILVFEKPTVSPDAPGPASAPADPVS